ncbi:macrolide transporter subunit MacA [Erwinia psidii]|uniref:Macrolide transporter subunit MacA n=1 Tax=Erwinia psidii TaxID=69224 RepID=A0A3N6UZV2_9GAMM|nr:macrolide transporter subunit MacA [Erwinia psidii]MCX8957246.1 macrolide transporter subunit MacA [Erwinia psidii]MCX8959616.1 macrolide transporter subunit MacA [Erwinia psidii]MCX8964559.1 macrolide transporter subunit MacA [Erwinia psidii]RQM38325.1 macrolide transporter subunit MacA [Erwinia psidii]
MTLLRKMGLLLILALAVVALTVWGYHAHRADPPPLTTTVARGNLEHVLSVSGILQPVRRVDVGSQASGQLKNLYVSPGDTVKQGQLLGIIDPTLSENTLKEAQVGLNSLQAQKLAAQAQLKRARLALRRTQEMYAEKAAARQDIESAEAELQVQRSQLAVIDGQIEQQQISVSNANTNLAYTRIVAPVNGMVLSVTTQEGQTVVASYQVPVILQIADLSTMRVRALIPEADISEVRTGQTACFTTLGTDTRSRCGKVRTVEPSPEKINDAWFFHALFDIPNPEGSLRPDMTALVTLVLGRAENALILPLTALDRARGSDRYEVTVLQPDGRRVTREVAAGISDASHVEILSGLKVGEKVVIPGAIAPEGGQS